MERTEIRKEPTVQITGTQPISTAPAAQPPGPSTVRHQGFYARVPCRLLLLALALPLPTLAQFQYAVTNGEATITGYTGSGGALDIPAETNGYPVTGIGYRAFYEETGLTSVTIGNGVTRIGDYAFSECTSLTNVIIPDSATNIGNGTFDYCTGLTAVTISDGVTRIGDWAFENCTHLTSMTIPDSVTGIGEAAFSDCFSLTSVTMGDGLTSIGVSAFVACTNLASVTIPNSVTNIGTWAFYDCTGLTAAYFQGNAPSDDGTAFAIFPPLGNVSATVYYLPGTSGWGTMFGGAPTVQWNPRILPDGGKFGVHAGRFGFTVMGASNVRVAVEACSDLDQPDWTPVTNLTCGADGKVQFTDPDAADQPSRYYRFRPE